MAKHRSYPIEFKRQVAQEYAHRPSCSCCAFFRGFRRAHAVAHTDGSSLLNVQVQFVLPSCCSHIGRAVARPYWPLIEQANLVAPHIPPAARLSCEQLQIRPRDKPLNSVVNLVGLGDN
jgi:hypothetical protein